MPLALLV
jgi:hypothetical protein